MNLKLIKKTVLLIYMLFFYSATDAHIVLDKNTKVKIIADLIQNIKAEYIMEENIPVISAFLDQQLKNGAYDHISDPGDFGMAVTDDLRKISKDKHMGLMFHPPAKEDLNDSETDDPEAEMRYENYSFVKTEHYPVNIGYLKFDNFRPLRLSKNVIDASMAFIANSDVVIIDLRNNGGGDPETVNYLCSYFISEKNKLINTIKERKKEAVNEFRTVEVPVSSLYDKPVFILCSNYTFSAAEEFCYDLQSLKRATIIGDVTGGGAHPVSGFELAAGFEAMIPYAKSVNPYTKSNWEGAGVQPDIKPGDEDALIVALKKAEELNPDPEKKKNLRSFTKIKNAELEPVPVEKDKLLKLTGRYGIRTVSFEKNNLFIQRDGGPKTKLIQISSTEFIYEGTSRSLVFNPASDELELTMNDGRKITEKKK